MPELRSSSSPSRGSGLSISARIRVGFGGLIATSLLLSATGYWGSSTLSNFVDEIVGLNQQTERVMGARVSLSTMNEAVLRFVLNHQEPALASARASAAQAADYLAGAAEHTVSEERRKAFLDSVAILSSYRADIEQLFEFGKASRAGEARLREGDVILAGLTNRMVEIARATVDDVLMTNAAALEVAVVNCRAAAWQLIAERGAGGTEAFDRNYELAARAMDAFGMFASGDLLAQITAVKDALAAYRLGLRQTLGALSVEIGQFDQRMTPAMARIGTILDTAIEGRRRYFEQRQAAAHDAGDLSETLQLLIGLAGLVLGLAAAVILARGIIRPLNGMTSAMERLAAGDLSVDIPARGNRDEMGAMAQAMEVFKDNAVATREATERDRAAQTAKAERAATIARLVSSFEREVGRALETLAVASGHLTSTAATMSETADQTSANVGGVAATAEQMTGNVQTVAVATEELSASISEIGRQMEQSATIAARAVVEAEATSGTIQGLATLASQVDSVVQIISDIAGQTNLLALNATIEAARAGEAGKGFAVVASEVKALANRTGAATQEISLQIKNMQAATEASVGRIGSIGAIIAEMSSIATTIASAVEQQGAATREIARNVQEAARGTADVSSAINGVRDLAAESGTAATRVHTTSDEMARQGEALKAEVEGFLAGIRAA